MVCCGMVWNGVHVCTYVHMYVHVQPMYVYIYVNFTQASFHMTLGSDAPLGLVERSPVVCSYMAAGARFLAEA